MLLAHDLGTTGDKASLHEDDGTMVASYTEPYDTHYAPGGHVEQDPHAWWDVVCAATRRLLERTGTAPSAVQAVSFSGQMMGAVLLDADFAPVRPAIIWADTRSGRQADRVAQTVGVEKAYRILGHRLNPTYTVTKTMWVRDNEPGVFARVRHVCAAKDYIGWRLTGRLVTDPSDASAMNAFDQHTRSWSVPVLDAAGLDPALFPDIVPSTHVAGTVTAQAAEQCGLATGTAVVVGGGDGPMAAVGAGVTSPEHGPYTYLGTSSWISLTSTAPLYDPGMATMTFDHVRPGHFVPTATMQAGGGSLDWVSDVLEPGRDAGRFARLVTASYQVDASADGLYFLPYVLGERSPYWNPDARGTFVGLSRHHGPAELTRAVLEGVGFNLLTCIEAFRATGVVVESVDAVGGGAESDVWLQILADQWGCVVRRRTVAGEGNSLGAAVTAGVGIGSVDDFARSRELSRVTAEFAPDEERHAAYAERHRWFTQAYDALAPWFSGVRRSLEEPDG
ncbi:MAG: xylulokinase [Actinomycetes bacterium]